jgi:hypothetical protein
MLTAYFSERNIAMTVPGETLATSPCPAPFDPVSGLLNLRKRHAWLPGECRPLQCCRLCGKTRKEAREPRH